MEIPRNERESDFKEMKRLEFMLDSPNRFPGFSDDVNSRKMMFKLSILRRKYGL